MCRSPKGNTIWGMDKVKTYPYPKSFSDLYFLTPILPYI